MYGFNIFLDFISGWNVVGVSGIFVWVDMLVEIDVVVEVVIIKI